MSELAIYADALGKVYRISQRQQSYKSLREALTDRAAAPFRALRAQLSGAPRNGNFQEKTFWALRNISFEIKAGEIVGFIGRNGAGKSTLLKILSRITEPTEGEAVVIGRVGTLLEVGTGFHPELTGRENVFLNGAILGMPKAEITRKFEEIVAFSEVERFIDTPVKHYSSGMHVRLAFGVAAHLETDILFVDEVLSVGDAEFQKKCLSKMQGVGDAGRTVILVSHNMTAIQRLCQKVFWIDHGEIVASGHPKEVVGEYLHTASTTPVCDKEWLDPDSAPGNEKVRLRSARVRPLEGDPADPITVHTPFMMEFEYWNLKPQSRLNLSLLVYTEDGVLTFNTGPVTEPVWNGKPFPAGLFRSVCYLPGDLLNDGLHRVTLLVVENQAHILYSHEDLLTFEVHEDAAMREGWYGDWPGAMRPLLRWTTELVSPVTAVQQR
jgi:lipopolysaccharide transport system ATP-binding protein